MKGKWKTEDGVARLANLPLLALRGLVVFPNMLLHFRYRAGKKLAARAE